MEVVNIFSPCMAERNTMSMKFYTKCVFISSTHVIFDITIRSGAEVIAEGNVVLNSTLDGDYELYTYQQYENEVKSLFEQALARCKTRAQKILGKN